MVFVQPEECYVEKVFSVQEEEVAVLAADKRRGVAAILLQGKLKHKTDPHGCQKETLKRSFRCLYYSLYHRSPWTEIQRKRRHQIMGMEMSRCETLNCILLYPLTAGIIAPYPLA